MRIQCCVSSVCVNTSSVVLWTELFSMWSAQRPQEVMWSLNRCVCARYSMLLLENSQSHNLKHTRPAPGEVTREERKERQGRDKKRERKHWGHEALNCLLHFQACAPGFVLYLRMSLSLPLSLSHMALCFSIPPHCTLLKWLLQGKLEFKMRFYYKIFVTDTRCARLQMRKARVVEWKVT